jgi:lysophospholipase L1-like esterase
MRRSRNVALACAIALSCVPGAASRAATAPGPIRMTVVGDSLAFGIGATDPTNALGFRIYRALLADRPGTEVTDLGIGGSRVADVTRLQVAQIAADAQLVVVIAGGNDVVRHTLPARFASDYAALLAAIRRRVPSAAVVVCGVPDVARSPLFSDAFAKTEALSREDDGAVKRAAAATGSAFVDLFDFTHGHAGGPEFFSSDDFHPNDAGYAALAAIAIPVVRRALRGR